MKTAAMCVAVLAGCAGVLAGELDLKAAKDTFGRSNQRIRNNGAAPHLLVAHAPSVRSLIAFDLSTVTNRIGSASLRIRMANAVERPVSLVLAPMVRTSANDVWGEGSGNLGMQGRNALVGEATYARSAYPGTQWQASDGTVLDDLGDGRLWLAPVARIDGIEWKEGESVDLEISDVRLLEAIRTSSGPSITFGLWGTSGNGLYAIGSKESGGGPVLHLELEEGRQ